LRQLDFKENKMKFLKIALVAAALTGFAASAQAQDSGLYGNIGAEAFEFDSYNIVARLGYQVSRNLSVEGQGSLGVIDEEVEGFDVGVDNSLAIFAKGSIPISDQFSLFTRTGYHFTKFGVDGDDLEGSVKIDGFAFGGGVEYLLDGQSGLRADVTFLDSSDNNIDGIDFSGRAETYAITYIRKF